MTSTHIDLRTEVGSEEIASRGRALRETVPTTAHDYAAAGSARPDVLSFIKSSNEDRLAHLIPLRIGRMISSPFAFFRGAAGLMAADLADSPVTGLTAQLCGDAHAANFGLYGTARGEIVMDINDFDETMTGPWNGSSSAWRPASCSPVAKPGCRKAVASWRPRTP